MNKILIFLAVCAGSASAAELALTPVNMGYAAKDKDYTYGVVVPKTGGVVGDTFLVVGYAPNEGSSMFCSEFYNAGIMGGSYVVRHRTYQASTSEMVKTSFRSMKQDDWVFAALLGCGASKPIGIPEEETLYIPMNAASFAIPYPLRDFVAKLDVDKNLQVNAVLSPK